MPRDQQYPADTLNALAVRNNQLDIHDLPFSPSGPGLPQGRGCPPCPRSVACQTRQKGGKAKIGTGITHPQGHPEGLLAARRDGAATAAGRKHGEDRFLPCWGKMAGTIVPLSYLKKRERSAPSVFPAPVCEARREERAQGNRRSNPIGLVRWRELYIEVQNRRLKDRAPASSRFSGKHTDHDPRPP